MSIAIKPENKQRLLTKLLASLQKLRQPRPVKLLASTEMNTDNLSSAQAPVPSPSANTFHLSGSTLPWAKFLDVYCEGKLHSLIISGKPSPVQLIEAWENILSDYVSIIGTSESQYLMALQRQIGVLETKIACVDTCLLLLSQQWQTLGKRNDKAVQELGRMGYRFPFNDNDAASFERDLKAVHTRSKTLLVELETKQKDLQRVNKSVNGKIKERADFDAELMTLSRYQGYNINEEVITVTKYANIYKSFVQYVGSQKEKKAA